MHLRSLAHGRRVLHIGCTDSPLTSVKLASGQLLHAQLLQVSSAVIGVDVDATGVAALQDAIGGDYLVGDVSDSGLDDAIARFAPEIILASDVIEHVPNIGAFLGGLRRVLDLGAAEAHVVLTTPNALTVRAVLHTAFGLEVMHPDHRVVFTPATMRRQLADQLLEPTEWAFYWTPSPGPPWRWVYDRLSKWAMHLRPAYGDGMVVTARAAPPP